MKFIGAVETKAISLVIFLHFLPPTPSGFLAARFFYSPHLSSTLVSPCDILKMSKKWKSGFSGQDIETYFGADDDPNFGCYCLICHHNLRCSHNIVINGAVMNRKCYIYPLILPDVYFNILK